MTYPDALPDGFKMTELGPLPEEWQVVRLGEVADFSRRQDKQHLSQVKQIPFVPMSLIPEDSLRISTWELRNTNEITHGSLIFDRVSGIASQMWG